MRIIFLTFLSAFVIGPIALLFLEAPVSEIVDAIRSDSILRSFVTTLISCFFGSVFSVVFAVPLARYFGFYEWRTKRLQRLMTTVPYLVPNFILAAAYVMAWNPTSGLLNVLFTMPLYGIFGLILLFGISHVPIAFLVLEERFRRVDVSMREASRLSGASVFTTFYKIELPILLPSLISVFAVCFALNASAFAIPAWIGAPAKEYTLTYKVFQAIQVEGPMGIPRGAAISVFLFALAIVPVLLGLLISRKEARYVMVSGKASRRVEAKASGQKHFIFQILFYTQQILFWVLPLGCLALSTLVPPGCLQSEGLDCLKQLSIETYRYVLFDLPDTKTSFVGSLMYGLFSSAVILLICVGTLAAFVRKRAMRFVEILFAIPIATPGAIIALGLIVLYSGRFHINFYNTAWIVVIAFVLKHLNLAFQPLRTGYMNIAPSLLEAGRLSGSTKFGVWRSLVLPILAKDGMGAFFLAMIPILGELTMSVFLANPEFKPIGVVIFDLQDYADQASASALSVLLVISILILNEMAYRLSQKRVGY